MPPTYDQFSAADFLTDDTFVNHQLLPTAQSSAFWNTWLAQHPQCRAEWQQAVTLLEAIQLGLRDYAQTHLPEETIRELLRRIQQTNTEAQPALIPARRVAWMRWAAAAAVLLLMGIGFWWQQKPVASPYQQQLATLTQAVREQVNETSQVRTLHLPDRSVVLLAPNSRLSYTDDFDQQNRTVYLSGEATFEVVKNARKPFLVHANKLITRVLGTRFLVRAFQDEADVRVQVQSGQVEVYTDGANPAKRSQTGVLLLPNQQVVFTRQTAHFNKLLIDNPRVLAMPVHQKQVVAFSYNEAPISQVFDELEATYGIDIQYNKEELSPCQLTSSMAKESFDEKLQIICKAIGATYESIDGQIVIKGGNCQ